MNATEFAPSPEDVSEARERGRAAYESGARNGPRPHPFRVGTPRWHAWWQGWSDARTDDLRAQGRDERMP